MCPPGDLACNPGMCPDWELNQRTFWFAGWCSIHWATLARATPLVFHSWENLPESTIQGELTLWLWGRMLCVPQRQWLTNRSTATALTSQVDAWKSNPPPDKFSAISRAMNMGNFLPFHIEVAPLVAKSLYPLWGIAGVLLYPFPILCKDSKKYLRGVRTHNPTRCQKIWVEVLPHFWLGNHFLGGRCSSLLFGEFGLSFWLLTGWKHQEQKGQGAKLLRWALKPSCLAGLNIFWIVFFKCQITLRSENNLAFGKWER